MGQSVHYEHVAASGSERYRVLIVRNTYDEQCQAGGYVYSGESNRWNLLVNLPLEFCDSKIAHYADKKQERAPFVRDAGVIFAELQAIVERE